ncbi:MAG: signal peptide peptidase SppA [Bacteroidales bacterium]|jgi:protease-4|nr:signal peptide peptidase SppA [Bacteroidales bacterium]MDI9575208.1 signal peptide peptidase SppA [Bacteroidota bacterium]MDY0400968.1 signal peptide peptidase SppA [Bacteroidales bacterium]HHW60131.1 signal peptide peptidase SppA [Bacteroidales bacterium]
MSTFSKNLLANLLGNLITLIIFFILLFFFIMGMISLSVKSVKKSSEPTIEYNVLKISLATPIKECEKDNIIYYGDGKIQKQLSSYDVVNAINYAIKDDKVKGIILDCSEVNSDLTTLRPIKMALDSFKRSGKFVYSYSNNYTQTGYYVATASDKIALSPIGSILWKGVYLEINFYKNLLQKMGVEMIVLREGKYKGAVEPYIQDKMSPENREQYTHYANQIWNTIITEVSQARNIPIATLNLIADSLYALNAQYTYNNGMVDTLMTSIEFNNWVENDIGNRVKPITIGKYIDQNKANIKIDKKTINKIAIVFAEGEIMMKGSLDGKITAEKMVPLLRKLAEDDNVKAVVLRINSPGGDAVASDVIWHELMNIRSRKPLVISMGSYAASGGYYLSSAGNYIFAEPTTLTGSIGVFGLYPVLDNLLNKKLGISQDGVGTNANSDFVSSLKRPNNYAIKMLQKEISNFYNTFLNRINQGRGLSISYIDSIGMGRIWTGIDGVRLKLVDSLGNINDAIKKAVRLSKIEEYRIVTYPAPIGLYQKLMDMMSSDAIVNDVIAEELKSFYPYYLINNIENPIILTRMPYDINFK